MTKRSELAVLIALISLGVANAQESQSPTATALPSASVLPTASPVAAEPTAGVSPEPSPSPAASATPSDSMVPNPSPSGSPSSARSVRITFLPPPMEGTISLGIYDITGKLVRVLVQEGDVDEFDVGADALSAKWDGKGDRGEDLPPGKYHARGYLVGRLKVEDIGAATAPPDASATDHVQVKLVSNPLSKSARLQLDLSVGSDEESIFLKTSDGLPLFTVIEAPQVARVLMTKNGEKSVDLWADGGTAIEQVRVSQIDKMMAFDAGDLELK